MIKISTTNIFNTRGSELIGSMLKKTFIIKVKKKKKKIIIISFLKYLEASLKFIKKLIIAEKKIRLIIVLPITKLKGKIVNITKKNLSLLSIDLKFLLRNSIIYLVAGDGFEPPTFRL